MNILLILSSVLLNCAAQLLIRKGMLSIGSTSLANLSQHLGQMFLSPWLWAALLCFGLSIVLWMFVLSRVEVSFAYPFNGIGYVIIALACHYLFGEPLSSTRLCGIVFICIGVYLISRS